jgi:hypothetical protein
MRTKLRLRDRVVLNRLNTKEQFNVCTVHCWVAYKNQHCALGYVHICLLLCGSYMFRHLRAMLRERLCPCELRGWEAQHRTALQPGTHIT